MRIKSAFLTALLLSAFTASAQPATPAKIGSPRPVLRLTGTEAYSAGGKNWIRHRYDVLNKNKYPAALFAPAPDLPPCGLNKNSARTWVDFYDAQDHRLYGFCALGSPADLSGIWFSTEEGTPAPARVYIIMTDRKTNTRYKSNLAKTSL